MSASPIFSLSMFSEFSVASFFRRVASVLVISCAASWVSMLMSSVPRRSFSCLIEDV